MKKKQRTDLTGDELRFEGLRISRANSKYLKRLGSKIAKWVPNGHAVSFTQDEGVWEFRVGGVNVYERE